MNARKTAGFWIAAFILSASFQLGHMVATEAARLRWDRFQSDFVGSGIETTSASDPTLQCLRRTLRSARARLPPYLYLCRPPTTGEAANALQQRARSLVPASQPAAPRRSRHGERDRRSGNRSRRLFGASRKGPAAHV